MPAILGTLRRLGLTPSLRSVTFSGRGFPVEDTPAVRHLEAIPQAVITGFEWGIEHRRLWDVERRLDLVAPEQRGFAYEGAAMAFTVRDAMAGGRGRRTRDLLAGSGRPHIFLTYIGIGFAMARLPRVLWAKVLPDLTGVPYHPTMSWLAVDGYGFDRAYFDTARWVDRQHQPKPYPWADAPDYFLRAHDQGVGRALWFIHGAVPEHVAAAVDRFPAARRPDLWSGVGLASTFAGGASPAGLAHLRVLSGEHRAQLALGSVFAAKGRVHSGFVPDHTEQATTALAGLSVAAADRLADATAVAPDAVGPGGSPAYELWRERIRNHFEPLANAA